MEAFDEFVADAVGAGFVAGGDTAVCAMAALDRTAVRNAVLRQKLVRDINVSSLIVPDVRQLRKNNSCPRKFELICVKAYEPLLLSQCLPTEANLAQSTLFEPRTTARGSELALVYFMVTKSKNLGNYTFERSIALASAGELAVGLFDSSALGAPMPIKFGGFLCCRDR